MSSNWVSDTRWGKINEENLKKYGTADFEEIEQMEEYAKRVLEKKSADEAQAKLENILPEVQKKALEKAVIQVRAEELAKEGLELSRLSPFITGEIIVNGQILDRTMFILSKPVTDPPSEEVRLYFDDLHERWLVKIKNGNDRLISRFVIVACFIVDASGPGSCRAFVVFLKGVAKPLIFWDGIIEPADLRRKTQFHQKGLSSTRRDLYHESFLRALSMCKAVYFLILPLHAGWNMTPDGLRVFVDSAMMQPKFDDLFLKDDSEEKKKGNSNKIHNVFLDVSLETSEREFEEVVTDYRNVLPNTLPVKIGTVISAMSRLLPQFQEEGLVQDRLWVAEAPDEATVKALTAILQNRNYQSVEVLFSYERITHIEDELKKYVDCVAILRHAANVCSKHDFEKIKKLLFRLLQNGYTQDYINRFVPLLIIDNGGIIPEELQIHQLSLTERLNIEDYEQIQRVVGELDYHIVKFAEKNSGAVKQRIKAAITAAKEMAAMLPRRSQSNSAIMFMSVAILLKDGGILTEADIQAMLQWLCNEVKERTSFSRYNAKTMGAVASTAISTGRIDIGIEVGPPFWTPDKAMISSDGSFCLTEDLFSDEIYSNSDVPVGINKAKEDLISDGDLLTYSNSKDEQRTWKVQTEDGSKKPRRFLTFSRDWLSQEANLVIDEKVASDKFHKLDEHIDNFFRFVKHERLDMYAGQVITDYKHGTPFIAVTGAPGSGKTDWMMQQVVQRGKADDVVIVLDPTNAFLKEELLAHNIPEEIIDKHFEFWDLSTQGWPVNIMDFDGCESKEQRVQKLSSLLISGLHLTGSNQKFILVDKLAELLEKNHLSTISELAVLPAAFDKNDDEKKLAIKLRALFSIVNMQQNTALSWGDRLSAKGKVLVISSGNAVANPLVNSFDILLDTLYAFKDKNRDGKMTVILDEVQTFNHGKKSTLVSILSRVRKLDISVILASQDYLNASLSEVYKYCGTHILFKPLCEECVKAVAKFTKLDEDVIRTLPDFHCAVMGDVYSTYYGTNVKLETAILGISYRPSYDIGSSPDEKAVNNQAVYVDVKAVRAATPATNELKNPVLKKFNLKR